MHFDPHDIFIYCIADISVYLMDWLKLNWLTKPHPHPYLNMTNLAYFNTVYYKQTFQKHSMFQSDSMLSEAPPANTDTQTTLSFALLECF